MMLNGQSGETYAARGASKCWDDICLGKRGEVLAHLALGTSPPDFSVLQKNRKNWSADLLLGNTPIHVKTCSCRTRYIVKDRSWTFERVDPIFANGGYVVLVYCESWRSLYGWVSRVYDFKTEIEPLLTEPRIDKYRGVKLCINRRALESAGLLGKS
jgi:hypothetical protein